MRAVGLAGCAFVGAVAIVIGLWTASRRDTQDLSYGIVLDAGSTGTRAHVGVFRSDSTTGNDLRFVDAHFFEMPKSLGAAAHASNPVESISHILNGLLRQTRAVVPRSKRHRTPVFCRATAGLRLLGGEQADEVLSNVFRVLQRSEYLTKREWVSILDEANEGLHAWITVNFLLGHLGSNTTVSTLDLGGGSVQIAYEVNTQEAQSTSDLRQVEADGHTHQVFTKSFLGYGLLDFRRRLFQSLESNGMLAKNPCINRGAHIHLQIDLDGNTGVSHGAGDFDLCSKHVRHIFESDIFEQSSKIPETSVVFAFAYFYDRVSGAGLPEVSSTHDIAQRGRVICQMSEENLREEYPAVRNGNPTDLCLDLSYIHTLMEVGFRLSKESRTQFTQHINGHMLGWAMGALFSEIKDLVL